jgi:hypothetical protein
MAICGFRSGMTRRGLKIDIQAAVIEQNAIKVVDTEVHSIHPGDQVLIDIIQFRHKGEYRLVVGSQSAFNAITERKGNHHREHDNAHIV